MNKTLCISQVSQISLFMASLITLNFFLNAKPKEILNSLIDGS